MLDRGTFAEMGGSTMNGTNNRITRRKALKLGAGLGMGVALGPYRALAAAGEPVSVGASGATTPKLITRPIPSSGEEIPVVGIGTARRYNVGTSAEERDPLRNVLRSLPQMGGRLVDTAPSYGTAETVVGDLVDEIGNREDLFLATKVRARSVQAGVAQMEQSFSRLKTEVIDLMEVHNLAGWQEMLPVIRDWKAAGRIRYVGATTSSSRQYDDFIAMMRKVDLDFIQVNYSLASRTSAETILPLAADRGMAVLVNLPYGRGRLFQTVGETSLPDWATEIGCASWGQVFLKYIVSHPAVTCAIPGTAKMKYLVDNLGAATGPLPDAGLRKRMEAFYDAL
jgi:aryl-alcohol dehydrogenase-like predicted oxidoreductase|tara:strand:+ start:32789 stop:33805 length:1017 start_codon:yes stop_codon:yes gene_type:complete